MAIEKASNHGANQSLSGKDYLTQLAFLQLGELLAEISNNPKMLPNSGSGHNEDGGEAGSSKKEDALREMDYGKSLPRTS